MRRILQICNEIPNVGDRLASYITEQLFGLTVIRVFNAVPDPLRDRPVLSGIGSCLGYYGEWPLHVWGTGFEPGYVDTAHRNNPGSRARWRVHAVRGHITRVALKLPADVVIGDPAILMPRLYTPKAAPLATVRYFCHCDNTRLNAGSGEYEVLSTRIDPFRAIDLLAASRFVFTEAMHIAILSHAYGIPWAWALNEHTRGMVKWFDWFSSIGVRGECFAPNDLDQAMAWYECARKEFQPIDTDRLISVFPHKIAFD